MKLVLQSIKNYLLFITLLILPINIWAASGNFGSLGDKNGFLKPVSKAQLEKKIKDFLIKQVKVVDSRPPRHSFFKQVATSQVVRTFQFVPYLLASPEQMIGPSPTQTQVSLLASSMTCPNKASTTTLKKIGMSSTHLQECGVDESDLVKTDGRFLYAINNHGYDRYNSNRLSKPPSGIRIFDTKPNALQPRQIGVIGFAKGLYLSGLFLAPRTHQLVVIGESYVHGKQYRLRKIGLGGYYLMTHILQIDIKNKNKPRIIRHIKIEGSLKVTRRINNQLYLVLSHQTFSEALPPTSKHVQTYKPISKEQRNKYIQELINKIKQWKADSLFPRYQVLAKTGIKTLSKSGQFLASNNQISGITTLLAIDLSAKDFQFDTLSYSGTPDTVYVSQKALYIIEQENFYRKLKGLDLHRFPKKYPIQIIHKFAFKGKGFDYRGSGVVLGLPIGSGDQSELSSFNFNEDRRGNLRITTMSGNHKHTSDPATSSPVVLTVLAEHPKYKQLVTLSRLPNRKYPKPLGKLGYRSNADKVFLFNDFAYIFIFNNPLQVVDMRNPSDIKMVEGPVTPAIYPSYLHLINKSLLLSINTNRHPNLSLFDISNPNLPREVDKIIIKAGTSPIQSDEYGVRKPHALTSLRMPDRTTRIAIPINTGAINTVEQQGLHQFEVDIRARKIKPVGKLIPLRNTKKGYNQIYTDRSIIIGNTLYYYSDGRFWASKW